jgi:hypothetical protein
MSLPPFVLELSPFALIPIALLLDWARLDQLRTYSIETGLGRISTNPFRSSADIQRIKKSLPAGPLSTRIRCFEVVSGLCWIGFGVTTLLSLLKKHGI